MISLPTPTKSPTSQPLTDEQRAGLVELLVERYLDNMDLRDLEIFFADVTASSLEGYTDAELLGEVEDNFYDDEYEKIINELN